MDEAAYPREELAALSSPVADLFRIERSRDWSEVLASVHRLRQGIPPAEAPLREAFETWLRKLILPRLGLSQEEAAAASTLEEIETMLTENIDRWNREIREEGLQAGRQEGLQAGRQQGEARVVLRLLRLKFGPLDPEIEERVRSADADRLLGWSERILTAESLQDVFRD